LNPGVVTVRPFQIDDLDAAARFCEAARVLDPSIEPFAQRLSVIASGTRARLDLWRVAAGEAENLYGIAFSAVRDSAVQATFDFYAAVHPALRRQGLGRTLSGAALGCGAILRTRVRDDSRSGRGFLRSLKFIETGAQLSLQWKVRARLEAPLMPALRIRAAAAKDASVLLRLSTEAWAGAPDTFASRADEIAQLFGDEGRVALVAESEARPLGYLAGVQLGRTLGIEEVAVLPAFRRMGIGRALLVHALRNEQGAVLSVSEANQPARALYQSLGFLQTTRRIVLERLPEEAG